MIDEVLDLVEGEYGSRGEFERKLDSVVEGLAEDLYKAKRQIKDFSAEELLDAGVEIGGAIKLYLVEFAYADTPEEYHTANMVVYTNERLKEMLENYDSDDTSDLDELLYNAVGLVDTDIIFYAEDTDDVRAEIEKSMDIKIRDFTLVKEVK